MKKGKILFLALHCLIAQSLNYSLRAEAWQIVGPQPMAMGGSFVAIARGNLAQYWNPGGLAQENNISGLQIPIGARVELTGGLLKDTHNLSNIASQYSTIQASQKTGQKMDANQMSAFLQAVAALDSLNKPDKGLLVDAHGGVNLKFGRFTLSVNNYTSVGGDPTVDTKNIGLGAITGVAGSGVTFTGASTATLSGTNATSATNIATAIGSSGFTNIEKIICGSAGCVSTQTGSAITNQTQLANALVNAAASAGATETQISQAATAIVDNAPVALPVIASGASGNPYTNNTSNLTLRGASLTEVSLGYARPLILPGLSIGGNLKLIQAHIGYEKFQVLQKEVESTDAFKDFNNSVKVSIQPAVDLGIFYDLNKSVPSLPFRPRVGAVARNINKPKFDQPKTAIDNGEPSTYAIDPQVRMGVAFNPFNFWTLAADLDLTENKTPISGFKSRMFGAGTEINVFNRNWLNIPLRAGLMKNIAESNSKIAYTGGVGLNFLHIIIDIGGSISTDTEKFKDEAGKTKEVPANASLAAQFAFLF